jgi:predicted membrane protein
MDDLEKKEERTGETGHGHSRIWLALVLVLVGGALLLQELKVPLPDWLFSWQILLIVIGICLGFSHGFRGGSWAILILIGGIFLLDDVVPGFYLHRFIWPLVIIAVGMLMLIRPRRPYARQWQNWDQKWAHKHSWKAHRHWNMRNPTERDSTSQTNYSSEDFFDSTSVFGGVKKVILSKNFRGGDITCFMGGCEIDLTQADIQGRVAIDVTQVFGGTKLIVPPHWQIHTEMTAFFGSIEDKRKQPVEINSDKVLIIEGTSVFGGIEIRNY